MIHVERRKTCDDQGMRNLNDFADILSTFAMQDILSEVRREQSKNKHISTNNCGHC